MKTVCYLKENPSVIEIRESDVRYLLFGGHLRDIFMFADKHGVEREAVAIDYKEIYESKYGRIV